MDSLIFIEQYPLFFLVAASLLGLAVGSFLNVVVYRVPKMLDFEWRTQCAELLACAEKQPAQAESLNLAWPASHCPHCAHPIKAWENIPILSYLLQNGRCTACHTPISLRYPLVEAITALITLWVSWHFGLGWPLLGALLLSWMLIALTLIDFDHQLLPDNMTLPLLWLGLLLSIFQVYTDMQSSLMGAMIGYLFLWSVYWGFKLLTGKEGMGYGDFKLFAALGAWFGWQSLLLILLLSSVVGAIIGITLILLRGHDKNIPIPFGPYLACAGWVYLMWGNSLMHSYLQWIRLD